MIAVSKQYFKAWDGQPRKRFELTIGRIAPPWYVWGNYHTYNGAVAAFKQHNKWFGAHETARIRDRTDNSISYIKYNK